MQLPRNETWTTPSTVCDKTVGSGVGKSTKVVPALARISTALTEALVRSPIAQAIAQARALDVLDFVIPFFFLFRMQASEVVSVVRATFFGAVILYSRKRRKNLPGIFWCDADFQVRHPLGNANQGDAVAGAGSARAAC